MQVCSIVFLQCILLYIYVHTCVFSCIHVCRYSYMCSIFFGGIMIFISSSTLSSIETPYPMLILTGPSGACKRVLVRKLCQEFPSFFGHG